jgi:predicted Zn-dependent protease
MTMRDGFFELAGYAFGLLRGGEVLLANFDGEVSDFVRFNHARVRQPMTVRQAYLTLQLVDGRRHDRTTLSLAGGAEDREAIAAAVAAMRADLPSLPEDPYLLYSLDAGATQTERRGRLPSPAEAIDTLAAAGRGLDMVGVLASGPVCCGFASSLGARHWHEVDSFLLDWSVYQGGDKAVKASFAGQHWDAGEIARRVEATRAQLPYLARSPRTIEPGAYRAYVSPAALDELLWMLNWGGVSAKEQRTQQSTIQQLVDGEASLSPLVTLREHTAAGLAPAFDEVGFTRPAAVELIRAGRHAGSLVSPRTAQEYGIESNGAGEDESMQAMELAPGSLARADALRALDTGVYVGNFHYLNWSDRSAARITGLTRFATYWVERGEIVAPLSVMRFDDSLYRMLGSELEALDDEADWILNSGTYDGRSVETSRVPGALLRQLRLTL